MFYYDKLQKITYKVEINTYGTDLLLKFLGAIDIFLYNFIQEVTKIGVNKNVLNVYENIEIIVFLLLAHKI